jgi:hypothetical protein
MRVGPIQSGFDFHHDHLPVLHNHVRFDLLWMVKDLSACVPGEKAFGGEPDFLENSPYTVPEGFLGLQTPTRPKATDLRLKRPTKQCQFVLRALLRPPSLPKGGVLDSAPLAKLA